MTNVYIVLFRTSKGFETVLIEAESRQDAADTVRMTRKGARVLSVGRQDDEPDYGDDGHGGAMAAAV